MDWIDKAARLRETSRQRNAAISEREDPLFQTLADELKRHVEAAKVRPEFSEIVVDRQAESLFISFPIDRSAPGIGLPRRAAVSLVRGSHEIVADISGVDGTDLRESFHLDIGRDGSVGFKRKDDYLPPTEVAIYILWPLLYPEIGPYPGAPKQHIASVNISGI